MSREQIEHLLQECLEGYDAGLSPEECLSAYPHARAELEPMFRQALSLRFAYAASPSEEFKRRGRETLLFHAGRDISQALSKEPREDFVIDARQRFLAAAGAQAQEALRDVPPPRLPFWVNARRRLLEAAANPAPRPTRNYAFAMRSALSAAVVFLALGVAALGFMLTDGPGNGPGARSASANIDYIEQQLEQIERQNAQGIKPPSEVLVELTNLTSSLSAQVAAGQVEAPIAARLPALIDRQQEAVIAAVATSTQDQQPALLEASVKLSQAGSVVAAAVADTPVATNTSVAAAIAPTATATPKPAATEPAATPGATATTPAGPTEPEKPTNLQPGQILVQADITDKTYATAVNPVPWVRVTTSESTFVIAADWRITNIETDKDGFASIGGNPLTIQTGNSVVPSIVVALRSGEVFALINGNFVQLRSEDGKVIEAPKLLELVGGNNIAPFLHHFVTSFKAAD